MVPSNVPRSASADLSGWIAPHVAAFLERLTSDGYALATLRTYERVAERFCAEIQQCRIPPCVLDADLLDSIGAAVLEGMPERSRRDVGYPLKRLARHLADAGVAILNTAVRAPTPMESLGEEYERYLRHQRGLSEATIYASMRFFVRFMTFRFGERLGDLQSITPDDVVAFLLQFRRAPQPCRDKTPPTHLRNLFQFLYWSGKTRINLSEGLPRVAKPRDKPLPRHLGADDVQRLLDAVRADDAIGRRNYAMLLLLARLGLRAPEVIAIRLEDIDWRTGEILIRGKGRLHDRMPLPADVGAAIVDYIRHGRAGNARALFVATRAPHRPFVDSQVVNAVLQQAFRTTGLKPPQSHVGSHVLRHSLATDLLRRGASLDEVGDVLRHRSRSSTTLYAKYDVDALRSIARPWPTPTPMEGGESGGVR